MTFKYYDENKKPHCCKNCKEPVRHVGCHGTCETFLKADAEWKKHKAEMDKKFKLELEYHQFKQERVYNTKKATAKANKYCRPKV